MNRKGRILNMALQTAGIIETKARRSLNFGDPVNDYIPLEASLKVIPQNCESENLEDLTHNELQTSIKSIVEEALPSSIHQKIGPHPNDADLMPLDNPTSDIIIEASSGQNEVPEISTKHNLTSQSQVPECLNTSPAVVLPENNAIPSNNKNRSTTSGRCNRQKHKPQKQYLDYMSEDELFLANYFGEYSNDDSDVWVPNSDTTDTDRQKEDGDGIVGDRGLRKKKKNVRRKRKECKNTGKEYITGSGKRVEARKMQPNPCLGKKCGNDCGAITDEKRQSLFDHYWKLPQDRRKDWIVSLSKKNAVKRKRASDSHKRNVTYKYFINEGEGSRQVCLQFLCATIDVSHKLIYYTLSNAEFGSAKDDMRGKCEPPNKTKETTKEMAVNYIKSLPAVPSHYCRKDSNRLYLSQEYKNLANVYKIYKKVLTDKGSDVVSERVFRDIFNHKFNIGFHVPKKDKCAKCLKYEGIRDNDATLAAEKQEHETEKIQSFNRFKSHQEINKTDPSTLCVSFDLEKVLNTPHGKSMLLYYSRKLSVYNMCFYESNTRIVHCFYWDEVNGKRGANEISSIMNQYINMVDERATIKNLLLYCDYCPGQNRNRTVLAMIHSTLQSCKNIETIQINFLLTGHTYMPVDSVHAVIENNLKNCIIYAPSQWYTVFSTARQTPMPYNVKLLTFKDFMQWDAGSDKYFKGNLTGKISKIRVATFKKKDLSKIAVKYSMNESEASCFVEVQSKNRIALAACYKNLLPVSKAKYDDLNKLCKSKVIPTIFHQEYVNLPTSASVKDTLAQTDVEDCDE